MHVAARARLVLARHPWFYWVVVAALAAAAAAVVHTRLAAIDAARDGWGSGRTVLVAQHRHEPGDPIRAALTVLPDAAIPDDALVDVPVGAVVRQRVGVGEVLTRLDITAGTGPAALAEPGTVVVGLYDPLARDVTPGLRVRVTADGLVLAGDAEVTGVADDVIFVAVDDRDAAAIAAAAQQGIASLLYLP